MLKILQCNCLQNYNTTKATGLLDIKRKTHKNRTKDMLIVVLVKKSSSEKVEFDFVMDSEVLNTGRTAKIVQQIGHIITKHKAFSGRITDGM